MAQGNGASTHGIDALRLKGLVGRIEAKKQLADDVRGELGLLYQEAEEGGFHRRAIKAVMRLRAMEKDKRNDYLRSLSAYCAVLGVFDEPDLFGEEARVPQPPPPKTSPFTEGRAAQRAGIEQARCPHPVGSAEHEAWREGWHVEFNASRPARGEEAGPQGIDHPLAEDRDGVGRMVHQLHGGDDSPPPRRGRPRKAAAKAAVDAR